MEVGIEEGKQRWYRKVCQASYKTKFGVLVELVLHREIFGLPPLPADAPVYVIGGESNKQFQAFLHAGNFAQRGHSRHEVYGNREETPNGEQPQGVFQPDRQDATHGDQTHEGHPSRGALHVRTGILGPIATFRLE